MTLLEPVAGRTLPPMYATLDVWSCKVNIEFDKSSRPPPLSVPPGSDVAAFPGVRIAIVATPHVRGPPRHYGGTELIVAELCRGLVARGQEVTLFTCGGSTVDCEVRALYDGERWPPDPYTELDHAAWAAEK